MEPAHGPFRFPEIRLAQDIYYLVRNPPDFDSEGFWGLSALWRLI